MRKLSDIFAIWDSRKEMADDLGEKPSTVSKWLRRKRIPESAWTEVIAKAALRGTLLKPDDFLRLNAKSLPRGGGSPLHPNHRRAA